MPQALSLKPFISSAPLSHFSKSKKYVSYGEVKGSRRLEVVAMGMLAPRKFLQRRKKVEVFKDATHEAEKKKWWRIMTEIEKTGSAVSVLRSEKIKSENLPRDLVLGTLVRFKQMKSWNIVTEILEWLRTETWWDFNEMDFLMLITAYGKLGDFNKAETVFSAMTKKGYAPSLIAHTALLEAYGKGGRYNNAEAIFRRMLSSGPEPSALTYQIMLKIFVEANKYGKAEEVFETLLNAKKLNLKPDAKMFHMMIYMYKKAGRYEKARKLFALMAERGVPRSTVTYNSLMSFETNYKEVSNIYDQMQRADIQPDVLSYAMLINAYGKARREEEALAVFEEMLDAGVRPTQKAYNILLDAFAISGMVEQARIVFKSMQRDRCKRDICSYTTVLSAYVNASDMEGAEKFFSRIKQDGLEPNVVTYGALIKGYARINELEKMMEKYKEMRLGGIKANQTIFTIFMDAYGKNENFGSAVAWYKQMESSGLPPDQKAKNILLSLAETREEKEEANELVGYSDHCNNEQRISGKSTSDDEDDQDDEIDDYGVEDSDEAKHAFSPAPRAEEYVVLNGDHQHTLETRQSLSSLEL